MNYAKHRNRLELAAALVLAIGAWSSAAAQDAPPPIGVSTSAPAIGFPMSAINSAGFSADNTVAVGPNVLSLGSTTPISWSTGATATGLVGDTSIYRGGGSGAINLAGTTPRVMFGGTTAAFAMWKSTGISAMDLRAADDSSYATGRGSWSVTGTLANNGTGNFFYTTTGPSAPSSCGTSPAVTTANGSAAFVITGGTGGAATGCTLTMTAAATGWVCTINNITATAAHRADRETRQTASTTTSITFEYQIVSTGAATAFTASDVFRGICMAY